MKRIITSFRLPQSIIDRIKAVAHRSGKSQTEVVESILDSNLPTLSRSASEVGDSNNSPAG